MTALGRALRTAFLGTQFRDLHFYFGTVAVADILRALVADVTATRGEEPIRRFEMALAARLGVREAVTFGAGRMALYAILDAFGIGPGDEVILPGFTCVVVPNAIAYRGATPVFADIDPVSWNISPDAVERAITPRTRAVLVQHTFGLPCAMDEVLAIARRHGIAVIEDCAHVLGGTHLGRSLGTLGDASFFSFESSKPLTLGRGGAALGRDTDLLQRLRGAQDRLPVTSRLDSVKSGIRLLVLAALHHPNVFRFGKFAAGVLFKSQTFHANITSEERAGRRPRRYPIRLTRFQALLGLRQLDRLNATNDHRVAIASLYRNTLRSLGLTSQSGSATDDGATPLLRYAFALPDTDRAVEFFAVRQIELGRWFDSPVSPVRLQDPEVAATGYVPGSCPVAERVVEHCVNLPTDPAITPTDAARIGRTLRDFVGARSRNEHAAIGGSA